MLLFSRKAWLALVAAGFILSLPGAATVCRAQDPTYHKDVLPILQKHCTSCHHKGGTAPQSFEDYRSMKPWVKSTKKTVNERSMPPWHADPAIGKWKNDGRLTDAEMKTLAAWADAKAPEGDAASAPPKIDFAKPWKIGQPGQILKAPAFKVPSAGTDIYKAFVLAPEFAADTWVEGIELSPGAPDIVAHMAVSAVPTADAKKIAADAFDPAAGGKDFLAVWNKGISIFEKTPAGSGIMIPKGSSLVLYVHCKPIGEEVDVEAQVGLHPAKAAPAKKIGTIVVSTREFDIAAGSADAQVKAEAKLEKGGKVLSILPLMHYIGSGLEVTAHTPDGKSLPLLKVTDFSYDLQTLYTSAEPVALPAGTRIEAITHFNNTADNANNPNTPPKAAKYGPAPAGEAAGAAIQILED